MTEPGEDPRTAFLQGLPRKLVEVKATLGALIADPRSARMRDELRRRLHALFVPAQSYALVTLAEGIRSAVDVLDTTRSAPQMGTSDLDRLTLAVTSLALNAETDTRASPLPEPVSRRGDVSRAPTLVSLVPPPPPVSALVVSSAGLSSTASRVSPSTGGIAFTGATSVLFVGSHTHAAILRGVVPADVDILSTIELDEAIARARDSAPDVIFAEVSLPADGVALVAVLRKDPLTDFLPVVLMAPAEETVDSVRARCPDAAEVLPDGADTSAVRAALERAITGGASLTPSGPDLGELTLDELTRTIQDELRRGLVGAAAPRARTARVALGAGSEVLAATWEAIARIRSVVERRSGGQVRFDQPAAPRGLPGTHVFSLGDDAPHPDEILGDDPLPGRRALVVDDDPAVVGQFASLLREAGMEVDGRHDGAEALRAARNFRPDVVIADILMPGLDGFALCRAVRRDVALRHTPVILLSWKDDLLVRMRELGAQAQGYLRKETRGEAILARVRAVLRARVRVLRRVAELTPGVEARGRIERVGTYPLLETTAESLHDATVTISDATSVTDLELREGALVSAVRTLQDGRMARGDSALLEVLGAVSGRFSVRRSTSPVRANLTGELSAMLRDAAQRIAALEDTVTGAALLDVGRVDIDREGALAYARTLTVPLRALIERLLAGETPRDLVLRDGIAPGDLESLLVELARRGAIQRVAGVHGEDRVAARLAGSPESMQPPAMRSLPPRTSQRVVPSQTAVVSLPSPVVSPSEAPPDDDVVDVDDAHPTSLADAVWRELRDAVDDLGTSVPDDTMTPAPVVETSVPVPDSLRVTADRDDGVRAVQGTVDDAHPTTETSPPMDVDNPVAAEPTKPTPPPDAPTEESVSATPAAAVAPVVADSVGTPAEDPVAPIVTEPPGAGIDDAVDLPRKPSGRLLPHPPVPTPERPRVVPVLWGMLIAGVVSFATVHWWIQAHPDIAPEPEPPDANVAVAPRPVVLGSDAATAPSVADATVTPDVRTVTDASVADPYLNPAPFLDGGTLPRGMGLLVIRPVREGHPAVEVQFDQRVVGNAPLQQPVGEGLHTVRFRSGVVTSYQFATVRSGRAVVLTPPTSD